MYKSDALTLMIDIGTNGELVLGGNGFSQLALFVGLLLLVFKGRKNEE